MRPDVFGRGNVGAGHDYLLNRRVLLSRWLIQILRQRWHRRETNSRDDREIPADICGLAYGSAFLAHSKHSPNKCFPMITLGFECSFWRDRLFLGRKERQQFRRRGSRILELPIAINSDNEPTT